VRAHACGWAHRLARAVAVWLACGRAGMRAASWGCVCEGRQTRMWAVCGLARWRAGGWACRRAAFVCVCARAGA
jgi:hypothetical protein